MRLTQHILLSATVSGLLWMWSHSVAMAVSAMCSGVLIDLDHWLDYLREHRRWSVRGFFRVCYAGDLDRVLLVLHGWEWLAVGLLASWWSGWNPWVVGLSIGWAHHLVADQVANRPRRWGLLLLYRWRSGFAHKSMYPE